MNKTLLGLLFITLMSYAAQERFYVGTYTRPGRAEGIYTGTIDTDTGKLGPLTLAAPGHSPNYIALSPDASHLYTITFDDGGSIAAYSVGQDGALKFINMVPIEAPGSCHLS